MSHCVFLSLSQDQEGPADRVALAEKQKPLFKKTDVDADADADEEVSIPFPDLMDIGRCFESGGVSYEFEVIFVVLLLLTGRC